MTKKQRKELREARALAGLIVRAMKGADRHSYCTQTFTNGNWEAELKKEDLVKFRDLPMKQMEELENILCQDHFSL